MADKLSKKDNTTKYYLIALVLIPAIILSHLATSDFTWWDDPTTIHQNHYITEVRADTFSLVWKQPLGDIYIPITYTVWAALAYIGRVDSGENGISLNPYLFHTTSIVFHLGSGLFVFFLSRKLIKKSSASAIAAMFYLLHPLQVESVGWVSGLKDILAGFFTMGTLYFYVKYLENKQKKHFAILLTLLTLGLLSKPSAMTTPLLAASIDYLYSKIHQLPGRWLTRRKLIDLGLIALPCIPIAILARYFQNYPIVESPMWARPFIFFDSITFYLYKLFLPFNLCGDYGRSPIHLIETRQYLYTWIPSLTILVSTFFLIRRKYYWPAICFFIFVFAPIHVLGLTRFDFQYYSTVADHYQYVAILGPSLLLGYLCAQYRNVLYPVSVIILAALSILTYRQTKTWTNDYAFLMNIRSITPNSAVAAPNLTAFYVRNLDFESANEMVLESQKSCPDDPMVIFNGAVLSLRMNKPEEAKARFEMLISKDAEYSSKNHIPVRPARFMNIAQEYFTVRDYTEALAYLERAEAVAPGNRDINRLRIKITAAKHYSDQNPPPTTTTTR